MFCFQTKQGSSTVTSKKSYEDHWINLMGIMKKIAEQIHVTCRTTAVPYLSSDKVFRQAVADDQVDWEKPFPDYNPPEFTARCVLENPSWADAQDPKIVSSFNAVDINKGINRRSYVSEYKIDENGRPLNPMGRTGLRGRGLLGKWGPNHAADAIVSRIVDGKLQYVSIARKDNGKWAIPGGMVDNGEEAQAASIREFTEEALCSKVYDQLKEFWEQSGEQLYQGYVDDQRNTDNAWMETTVFSYHDAKGFMDDVTLKAGDDATDVKWISVEPGLNLFPSHAKFIRAFAKKYNFEI